MTRKGIVLLALCLTTTAAEVAPIVSASSASAHCTGEICTCRRACPPRRSTSSHCHGDAAPATQMTSRCHHTEPTAPAPARPQILPAASRLLAPAVSDRLGVAHPAATAPGHVRHDLPPPRLLA